MPDHLFIVSGNKIASFITGENSLQFSSKSYNSIESFQEAWDKKLSLANKINIKYDSITSISKEENSKTVVIRYKTRMGVPGNCEFSFTLSSDYEIFVDYLVQNRYFNKSYEKLSAFKAVKNYGLGLLLTVGCTILLYYQALDIENGTARRSGSGRGRLFTYLLSFLGGNGVIAVGTLIACYLLYIIWKRYSNPPVRILLVPPGA